MNLLCPMCQKMLTVPDQHAGQVMKCPLCGNTFMAPALAAATETAVPLMPLGSSASMPAPAAAPAAAPVGAVKVELYGLRDPLPPPSVAPPPPPPPPPKRRRESPPPPTPPPAPPAVLLPGYQKVVTIWAGPRIVPWVAPVALFLVFLLLFTTWVYNPNPKNTDEAQTAQIGWGTAFGAAWNGLGLMFFLGYFVAFAAAVARIALPRVAANFPPWLEQFMTLGSAIIAGTAALSLFFLLLEIFLGFGIEIRGFPPYRTMWLELAFFFELVAVLGAALEFWLTVRKSKPLPRVDISW